MRYAMCRLHRLALRVASVSRCIGAIQRLVCCINMSHRCVLHRCAVRVASVRVACCMFPRCVLHQCALHRLPLHRCALRVASARVGVVHRCVLHVAAARVARCMLQARCIGEGSTLHRRALACCIAAWCMLQRRVLHVASVRVASAFVASAPRCRPAAPLPCGALLVRCACAARLGEGRAVEIAERRRDALVRSSSAACSTCTKALRCSTPCRYPAPKQRCVRG